MAKLDRKNLRIVSFVFLLPLLIEALTVFKHGPNTLITAGIYLGFLSIALISVYRQICCSDIYILLGIYSFFILNILVFPSTVEYYKSTNLVMVLIFYLPICSFVVRHIDRWDKLFHIIKPYSCVSVLIGIYIVFFSNVSEYEDYFTYMDFSYCILPFVVALYVIVRQTRSVLWLGLFLIDAICMILYGARATILYLFVFIICFEYISAKSKSKIFVLFSFLLIAAIISIFFDDIILYLSGIEGIKDSRFITKAVVGQLTDGGERDILIHDSIHRIYTMDLQISGLYGDRPYIRGIYPHNIALEIMMQFGLILGSIILVYFIYLMVYGAVKSIYPKMSVFLCCVLFGRFILSGSYIQDGSFWLWIFSMINICQHGKISNNKLSYNATYITKKNFAHGKYKR